VHERADDGCALLARGPQHREDLVGIACGASDDHPDPHVEGPVHLVVGDVPRILEQPEQGRHGPRVPANLRGHAVRQDAWQVLRDAAACDMRESPGEPALDDGTHDRQVAPVRREQGVTDRHTEPGQHAIDFQAEYVEDNPPGEGIPVRVKAIRREPDQDVTGPERPAVDDQRALHGANNEAGEIVLAVGVEPRHLRRFAPDEGAPVLAARGRHAAHDLLGDRGRQPARREVIQKEQRHCSLHEDVVHAVIHEVGTDGVVPIGEKRQLQLRAHAVGAGHEHGLAQTER
jgi:hypothetical protein